jgi:hypothetical protein
MIESSIIESAEGKPQAGENCQMIIAWLSGLKNITGIVTDKPILET